MTKYCLLLVVIIVFGSIGPALAQDPPANYGELAELMVQGWEVPAAADPGDGDPNIAALEEIGIGPTTLAAGLGVSLQDAPVGIREYQFTASQELNMDFMCLMQVLVWAAGQVGNIALLGEEAGTEAVTQLWAWSQRNYDCAEPPPYVPPTNPGPTNRCPTCYVWACYTPERTMDNSDAVNRNSGPDCGCYPDYENPNCYPNGSETE